MSEQSRLSRQNPVGRILDIVSGDFPMESRSAEYALGLLALGKVNRMLIEIIFSIIKLNTYQQRLIKNLYNLFLDYFQYFHELKLCETIHLV